MEFWNDDSEGYQTLSYSVAKKAVVSNYFHSLNKIIVMDGTYYVSITPFPPNTLLQPYTILYIYCTFFFHRIFKGIFYLSTNKATKILRHRFWPCQCTGSLRKKEETRPWIKKRFSLKFIKLLKKDFKNIFFFIFSYPLLFSGTPCRYEKVHLVLNSAYRLIFDDGDGRRRED